MPILKILHFHDAGFFSCCSVKLFNIIQYLSKYKVLPDDVDGSDLFYMYKTNKDIDITYNFFKHHMDISGEIKFEKEIIITGSLYQFVPYKIVEYKYILPFIKKYYTPSDSIIGLCDMLLLKYNIIPDNCIGVYYRGTDKSTETPLGSFGTYYSKICEIRKKNPDTQIILQTDTAQFIDYIKEKSIQNVIIINENTTTYSNKGLHFIKSGAENYDDMRILFATFLIIARCKHIICSSGNCSIWMMYFRGGAHNVHQFLHNVWF